jgi:hypothetical protein
MVYRPSMRACNEDIIRDVIIRGGFLKSAFFTAINGLNGPLYTVFDVGMDCGHF